jgi:hypothetical protein
MNIRFVVWDFRTPPTADELAEAIHSFGGGPIYGIAVDAGTDDYILALANEPVSAEQARRRWEG